MKFWELTSAFRSETDLLEQTLKQVKWKKYYDNFLHLNNIILRQDREILDEKIPIELALEICSKSSLKFWLYKSKEPKLLSTFKFDNAEQADLLTASEVLVRFGGKTMEEALEKSYTEV